MATAKITIKDGIITSHSDRYFVSLSENGKEYCGNGWVVRIKDGRKDRPGRIICHAEREYSDGPAVCQRVFKLADGTLGLAGGNIYSRYAYFRSEDCQKFLNKFGITAVKKEDPNRKFSGFSNYSGWGTASQDVWSDGKVEWDYEDAPGSREIFEAPGANPNLYSGTTYHTVSGATWAIVETKENYRNNHNHAVILYTTVKNVMSLEKSLMAHPEIGPKAIQREKEKLVWALNGTPIESIADVKVVLEKACRIPGIEDTYDEEKVVKFMNDHAPDIEDGTHKFVIHSYRGAGYSNYGIMTVTLACEQPGSYWETEPIAKGKVG